MPNEQRPLKVFLCHAHSDKDAVRALYLRLRREGVDVWLDKEKLLPGADWELEIRKAVREADVVVVCLSKQFNQAGFRQKEVRIALETAMEQPEGEIFIIPARLEECENLETLSKWHWVDLFEEDGFQKLMRALRLRADRIGATLRIRKGGQPVKSYPRIGSRPLEQPIKSASRERVLEAAIEKEVKVNAPASLFVWIRRIESKSIISVVSSIDEDIILAQDNVKTKGLEIEFPVEDGRILPVEISLRLLAHEFSPSVQQKKIDVPPEGDSEVCTFIVTPKKAGRLLLSLEVLRDEVSLATRALRTTAIETEKKEGSSPILVSIPIIVFVRATTLDLESISSAKLEDESKMKEKAEQEKAEREVAERVARAEAEREAAEKSAREMEEWEAAEKAAREQRAREAAEKTKREKLERDAAERATQERVKRESAEQAKREREEWWVARKALLERTIANSLAALAIIFQRLKSKSSEPLQRFRTQIIVAFVGLVSITIAAILILRPVDLYFTSDQVEKAEIYRLSNQDAERVTTTPGDFESWGPTVGFGTVYFTSDRDRKAEIYKLHNAEAVRVTNTPQNFESWGPALGFGNLYFTSNRDGKAEIYKLVNDNSVRVTNTPDSFASWDPAIGFGTLYFTSNRDGKAEIYKLVNNKAVRMTNTPENFKSWGPVIYGQNLYFTSDRSNRNQVYLLRSEPIAILDIPSWTDRLIDRFPEY